MEPDIADFLNTWLGLAMMFIVALVTVGLGIAAIAAIIWVSSR